MLLVLMAAAALAAAEPASAATGQTEVSPVTVLGSAPEKAAEDAKAKPKQVCFTERPTGSRRIQRFCYDRETYEANRERLSTTRFRETLDRPGGTLGGAPR